MRKELRKSGSYIRFTAITGTKYDLYGIDSEGRVWKYAHELGRSGDDAEAERMCWAPLTDWTPMTAKERVGE